MILTSTICDITYGISLNCFQFLYYRKAHSVYIVEVTRLDEKFICYVNVMSWERIKYPLADKPVSVSFYKNIVC